MSEYSKIYRDKIKTKCETCGGNYTKYSKEKHLKTKKHIKNIKKEEPTLIDEKEVLDWLDSRFDDTAKSNRSTSNKVARVNKNKYIFKKLYDKATEKTWEWFVKNHLELVKSVYDTPSSQSTALSTLKLILDHVKPLGDLKKVFYDEGKALLNDYIDDKAKVIKDDKQMSYEDLEKYQTDKDPIIALFAHLYNKNNNALRLGDWVNSVVGTSKTMNVINLKKGTLTRRISKVMPDKDKPDVIKLPKSLIDYIKEKNIKGALFGKATLQEIVKKISTTFGEGNGSRYWRTKYVTEIISKLPKTEKIKTAKNMNHSYETANVIYDKN